jgi:hypothetical protein
LTALHETLKLGRLPLFLPEEHYGHMMNVLGLGSTRVGRRAIQLREILPEVAIPHDDFEGTAVLISMMEAIASSEMLYEKLRERLLRGIGEHMAVESPELELQELRAFLDGPNLTELVAGLSRELAPGMKREQQPAEVTDGQRV